MRSLFVTPMLPIQTAADMGGKHRRAGMFLRALGRLSSEVHIAYIVPEKMLDQKWDAVRLNSVQSAFWQVPVCVTLLPRRARAQTRWNFYGSGILTAKEQSALYPYGGDRLINLLGECLDEDYDLVFADRLDAALPILACGRKPKRLFIDVDDIYHRVLLRTALMPPFQFGRRALTLQLPALILAEHRAIQAATLAFVCSSADAEHLRRLWFTHQVRVVPNAIETPAIPPDVTPSLSILYLGSYHHLPNVIAAERLISRIWPLIRAQVPDARLLIAGVESERLPSRSNPVPGVEYLGFVENISDLYARSRIVCAPITTGSGTRLKLLEAGAYARPMVSTRIGAEGLNFRDGHEILLREDDAALAAACVTLLRDDHICRQLGLAARAVVENRYEVQRIEYEVANLIKEACQNRLPAGR